METHTNLTLDYLREHIIPQLIIGADGMSEMVLLHGNTEQEAKEKAEELIKTIDIYRQPSIVSVYPHISGGWIASVKYYGLD
jgi:ABC-type dipeptide/oligopeptide/nickel transport system ATPase component